MVRSIPEQNTGPVWVSTTERTAASAAAASRCARNSLSSAADSALRRCGESSVIVATESFTEYPTVLMASLLVIVVGDQRSIALASAGRL